MGSVLNLSSKGLVPSETPGSGSHAAVTTSTWQTDDGAPHLHPEADVCSAIVVATGTSAT
ncbi:hypothetical protein NPIL_233881, partial [Nephila pilipes]